MKMTVEHWRNESDMRKQKYVEKTLSQWHSIIIIIIIVVVLHCSPMRAFASLIFLNLFEISRVQSIL